MSNTWRCPECETINQDKKCIICGYENPDFGKSVTEKPKTSVIPEQDSKPKIVQDSLKAEVKDEKSNSQTKKTNAVGIIIAGVFTIAAAFVMGFFANDFIHKNDTYDISAPTLTLAESNGIGGLTDTTASTTTLSEAEIDAAEETTEPPDMETETTPETTEPAIIVPNVVGLSTGEAVSLCEQAGIKYELINGKSDTVKYGYVISQMIPAGVKVDENAMFHIVISTGEAAVTTVTTVPVTTTTTVETTKVVTATATETTTTATEATTTAETTKATTTTTAETTEPTTKAITTTTAETTTTSETTTEAPEEFITIKGTRYSTSLTELDLTYKGLTDEDIKPLSKMVNLTSLSLWRNNISDISALSGLTNLTELNLRGNKISDISELSGLTNLTWLDLSGNKISDISALSGLTNLTNLILYENNISDISALSGLTNLTVLDLSCNYRIRDFSALSGLTNLTSLWLRSNNISDISVFKGLTNLEILDLRMTYMSDSDIEELKKALPNCDIWD